MSAFDRDWLDHAPVAAVVLRDDRVVYVNGAAMATLGYEAQEVLGRHFADFVTAEEAQRIHDRHARRVRGEQVPGDYETTMRDKQGRALLTHVLASQHGADTLLYFGEITKRAEVRERVLRLARLGVAVQAERTFDAVLRTALEGLPELRLSAYLAERTPSGGRLVDVQFAPGVRERVEGVVGPLKGYEGGWVETAQQAWEHGASYSDDAIAITSCFFGPEKSRAATAALARARLQRTINVRVDRGGKPAFLLGLVGEWLTEEHLAPARLFGSQISAALDAAAAIAELETRNLHLSVQGRVAAAAGEVPDLPNLFERGADELIRALGCNGIGIWLVDPDGQTATMAYQRGGHPTAAVTLPLGDTLLGLVVREGRPHVWNVEDYPPASRALVRSLGFVTTVSVPLRVRNKVVGAMNASFPVAREVPPAEVELLRAVGSHFATAVESQRLLGELRARVSELTLLNDIARESSTLDVRTVVERALRRIGDTFDADLGMAYVREGEEFVQCASFGNSEETVRKMPRLPHSHGPARIAVTELRPVVIREPAEASLDTRWYYEAEGVRTAVAIPFTVKGRPVGAVTLSRRRPAPFTEGDVRVLSAVGAQLGVAVESAQLFADTRRRLADLEAVNAIVHRTFAIEPGNTEAVLDAASEEMGRALGAEYVTIFMLDDARHVLHGRTRFGGELENPYGFDVPLEGDTFITGVIRSQRIAVSENVNEDDRVRGGLLTSDVPPKSAMVVPLTGRRDPLGCILVSASPGRRFSEAEQALASAMASQLAVALENAALYDEARRRVEELSLLHEVSRSVAGSLDLERVLNDGVEALRRLVDATHCFVLLYDTQQKELRAGAATAEVRERFMHVRMPVSGSVRSLSAASMRERRPIAVTKAEGHPLVNQELVREFHEKSILAAPLMLRDEPVGAVIVDECRRERAFTAAEIERIMAVSTQLAVAIDNARLYDETRRRLSDLAAVHEVARVISSSLDLDRILDAAAAHLMRVVDGTGCEVLLFDPDRHELRRAAARGAAAPSPAPLDAPSLAAEALARCAPVADRAPFGARTVSRLALPLHVRDQPRGVAVVYDDRGERAFGDAEIARAVAIASQLAIAVENARLYSEARRRAEEMSLLHEVGRSLVATLELKQVLDTGVRNLARIVDSPEAYLLLLTPDGQRLEIRAATGDHPQLLGRTLQLDPREDNLAASVFHAREPMVIEDALSYGGVNQPLREESGGRAYLALPLVVRDRAIGAAIIIETRAPRRFSPAEVERGASIANQLAAAVENARLYEDLRKSYADLARAQAQLVQRERLVALGELAAVVAHEVRNPLGVIFNSLGSIRRLLKPQGDAQMLLEIMGEEADRLNRIVSDLLDFARPTTPTLRPEPLERVLDDALSAATADLPPGRVTVERRFDPALPPVPMDARLLRQAVLNIALNAVQAMQKGGRLRVTAAREGPEHGGMARIEIADTGAGIPPELLARIFEPFFTTKATGTGLGLAVVKRIVEGHRGEIAVASEPGAGTTFTLRLPLEQEEATLSQVG